MVEKTQREVQSEQTRERIIEEAMRLFVRKGFFAASIADIAAAVGMTKGALYHHFESKDAIFFAVIETIRKAWRDAVGREVLKEKDGLQRLHALLDSHGRLIEKNDAFCLVLNGLMAEMDGVNPAFLEKLHSIYSDLVNFTEQIVRKGQVAGNIRTDLDARLIAFTLVGILRGTGCSKPMFSRLGVDYIAMTDTVKKVVLAGLKP
jgi:AcrR family transcriptional regulator